MQQRHTRQGLACPVTREEVLALSDVGHVLQYLDGAI